MNGHDLKLCECGCGESIPAVNTKRRPARFKDGHQNRAFSYEVRDCGYDTACWVFSNGISPGGSGYGRIRRDGKTMAAHRFSYERRYGPIPEGLELDHLCRNTICVNPAHLQPVTSAENSRRGISTKLTQLEVDAIRRIAAADLEESLGRGLTRRAPGSLERLARRFGVSKRHVAKVITGDTWREVV